MSAIRHTHRLLGGNTVARSLLRCNPTFAGDAAGGARDSLRLFNPALRLHVTHPLPAVNKPEVRLAPASHIRQRRGGFHHPRDPGPVSGLGPPPPPARSQIAPDQRPSPPAR